MKKYTYFLRYEGMTLQVEGDSIGEAILAFYKAGILAFNCHDISEFKNP